MVETLIACGGWYSNIYYSVIISNYIFNSRTDSQGFSHFHNGCICVLIFVCLFVFFHLRSEVMNYNIIASVSTCVLSKCRRYSL